MRTNRQVRFDDTAESTDLWRLPVHYSTLMESTYQHDYKKPVMAPPIKASPPPSHEFWNHFVRYGTMESTYQHDYKWPTTFPVRSTTTVILPSTLSEGTQTNNSIWNCRGISIEPFESTYSLDYKKPLVVGSTKAPEPPRLEKGTDQTDFAQLYVTKPSRGPT